MSTNVLLPLLIIALSIFFAFTAYLRTRTRSKSQPKVFRLQIPKKKKLRSRKIEDVQKNGNGGFSTDYAGHGGGALVGLLWGLGFFPRTNTY